MRENQNLRRLLSPRTLLLTARTLWRRRLHTRTAFSALLFLVSSTLLPHLQTFQTFQFQTHRSYWSQCQHSHASADAETRRPTNSQSEWHVRACTLHPPLPIAHTHIWRRTAFPSTGGVAGLGLRRLQLLLLTCLRRCVCVCMCVCFVCTCVCMHACACVCMLGVCVLW